jgi:hypothetical protein
MTRRTIEITAFFAALLMAAFAFHAWLTSRDDQRRLQSTLATQKQIIDSADARERTREAALNATLAQIDKLKRAKQTPQEILRDLPKYLPLPQPITLINPNSPPAPSSTSENLNTQQGTSRTNLPPLSNDTSSSSTELDPAVASMVTQDRGLSAEPVHSALPVTPVPFAPRCADQRPDPTGCASPTSAANQNVASQPRGAIPETEPGEKRGSERAPIPGSAPKPCASSNTSSNNGSSNCPTTIPAAGNQNPEHPSIDVPEDSASRSTADSCSTSNSCAAQIPAADLKPLYNYVQDCRACQDQLAAANQNLSDAAIKIAALTRERDAAITTAKGGTFWRRLRRNALWFAIGAATTYVATTAPRQRHILTRQPQIHLTFPNEYYVYLGGGG